MNALVVEIISFPVTDTSFSVDHIFINYEENIVIYITSKDNCITEGWKKQSKKKAIDSPVITSFHILQDTLSICLCIPTYNFFNNPLINKKIYILRTKK